MKVYSRPTIPGVVIGIEVGIAAPTFQAHTSGATIVSFCRRQFKLMLKQHRRIGIVANLVNYGQANMVLQI